MRRRGVGGMEKTVTRSVRTLYGRVEVEVETRLSILNSNRQQYTHFISGYSGAASFSRVNGSPPLRFGQWTCNPAV